MDYDVFISHASEDKQEIADPLARELDRRGYAVWYDNMTLKLGDDLRRTIDAGLARSRYGVVILSPSFFVKQWPQRELEGLIQRENDGVKVILPVWHKLTEHDVRRYSPILAGRLAFSTSRDGALVTSHWLVATLADAIAEVLGQVPQRQTASHAGTASKELERPARLTEPRQPPVATRLSVLIGRAQSGSPEDIDFMMASAAEAATPAAVRAFDHALGFVESRRGRDRLEHYLRVGSALQREFAALYFKRLGDRATLERAKEAR